MSVQLERARTRSPSVPARCHAAALADVVDYVSDRLGELGAVLHEPWFSAQSGRLQILGDTLEAEVGPFLIRSDTTPLCKAHVPAALFAWSSAINVRTRSGLSVSAEALTRLQATDNAAIALDRLCRILHRLNHLLQGREALDLWVPVGMRHLLAVDAGHGAFFEEILQRCGLGAERIVLQITPGHPSNAEWIHLQAAIATYRQRGFRFAFAVEAAPDESTLGRLLAIAPDWISGTMECIAPVRQTLPHAALCIEATQWTAAPVGFALTGEDLFHLPVDRRLSFLL